MQQRGAQPLALLRSIDRETAHHRNSNRMGSQVLGYSLRRFLAINAARGHGIVSTHHAIMPMEDVDPRQIILNVRPGKAFEPRVERVISAVKPA